MEERQNISNFSQTIKNRKKYRQLYTYTLSKKWMRWTLLVLRSNHFTGEKRNTIERDTKRSIQFTVSYSASRINGIYSRLECETFLGAKRISWSENGGLIKKLVDQDYSLSRGSNRCELFSRRKGGMDKNN